MLFENFKNYYILRYIIYEFLKKVLGVPQPTCLVRVFCALVPWHRPVQGAGGLHQSAGHPPCRQGWPAEGRHWELSFMILNRKIASVIDQETAPGAAPPGQPAVQGRHGRLRAGDGGRHWCRGGQALQGHLQARLLVESTCPLVTEKSLFLNILFCPATWKLLRKCLINPVWLESYNGDLAENW